jgi:hypothetical protein
MPMWRIRSSRCPRISAGHNSRRATEQRDDASVVVAFSRRDKHDLGAGLAAQSVRESRVLNSAVNARPVPR